MAADSSDKSSNKSRQTGGRKTNLTKSKDTKASNVVAVEISFFERYGQLIAWGVILFLLLSALFAVREILLPFVVGAIIAYFLHPAVTYLCHRGIKRSISSGVFVVLSVILLVTVLVTLIPLIGRQLIGLIENLPTIINTVEKTLGSWLDSVTEMLGMERADQIRGQIAQITAEGGTYLVNFAGKLIESSLTVVNVLGLLFVTPIVAFYMLTDWPKALKSFNGLFPRQHAPLIHSILSDIDEAISSYLRGQLSVMTILGTFYAIALTLIGLDFGAAIGVFAGLIGFVPYVGAISGLVVATTMAIIQFSPDWIMVGAVVAVFLVGQLLEDNFLMPRLVGSQINVHPVWMIFALFAFGTLFGLVGVFVAVPLAAITAVLVRYGMVFYKRSALYADRHQSGAEKQVE